MKVRRIHGDVLEGENIAPVRVRGSRIPLTSFDPVSCPKAQIIIVPGSWKKGLYVVASLMCLNK